MKSIESLEAMIQHVQTLDRDSCKAHLQGIDRPKLDFSNDYLDKLSLDRLRHILVAACLQSRKSVAQSH